MVYSPTAIPDFTLPLLCKELSTLTNPQSFAVYLGIPQDKIEIISQDYQCGMSIIIIDALA